MDAISECVDKASECVGRALDCQAVISESVDGLSELVFLVSRNDKRR